MKPLFKVKLTPNPIIVRILGETEEVIYDRMIKVWRAEKIVQDLNNGFKIDFDDLN